MDWSGVDYCDVFISCLDSQSDGTHSLQSIHCWDTDAGTHFSKSDDDLRVRTCSANINFWVNHCFNSSSISVSADELFLSALYRSQARLSTRGGCEVCDLTWKWCDSLSAAEAWRCIRDIDLPSEWPSVSLEPVLLHYCCWLKKTWGGGL